MRHLTIVLLFSVAVPLGHFPATAQEANAQSDSWRGLNLNISTPLEATDHLGKPDSDRPDRLILRRVQDRFVGLKDVPLRKLRFRRVPGFSRVDLYFKDDRLVVIQLSPKDRITPASLPDVYGARFLPVENFIEALGGPKLSWGLVAITERSVIIADVFAGLLDPEKVVQIQLVSRQLENLSRDLEARHGTELLR
jgi:hypothetical protein